MQTSHWLTDFEVTPGALVFKKDGRRLPMTPALFGAATAWYRFFLAACRTWPRPRRAAFTVAFTPDRPRPWYLVWPALRALGAEIVSDCGEADVVFHFEDVITGAPPTPPRLKPGAKLVNFAATDVSKSAVAAAFAETFGYALAVDPAAHNGPMVEKSELNGVHDGAIVQGPTQAMPGKVYQRVIDNRGPDGLVEDLRTPVIGGAPVCVFIKRRPLAKRFSNDNVAVELKPVEAVFSLAERERIAAFAARLGLDWGGLDVLRDAARGDLYIVDANKTDMGPPTALPLSEQLAATRLIADAFARFLGRTP